MAEEMAKERMEKAKTARAKVARHQECIVESALGTAVCDLNMVFLRVAAGKGGRGDGRQQLAINIEYEWMI